MTEPGRVQPNGVDVEMSEIKSNKSDVQEKKP